MSWPPGEPRSSFGSNQRNNCDLDHQLADIELAKTIL